IQPGEAPDALAVVRPGPTTVQSRDDAALYAMIGRRRTNRQPFLDAPTPASDRRLLIRAAADEHAVLHEMTDHAGRSELRRIVAAADQRQRDDVVCRAELEAWTGFRHRRPDGVPAAAAGPRPEPHDLWAYRDLGRRFSGARVSDGPFRAEPFVVVLASVSDGPAEQIQAGQALQRVLLNATALGLSASFLSQPIEVAEQRRHLRQLLPCRLHPQTVLRLGFSPPVTSLTPRRDPADLIARTSLSNPCT
ncbi:MAG TPA: nitroreductase family protein, partial [Nakamurella sp.]